MKPRWMRRHIACPDCGKTFTIDELKNFTKFKTNRYGNPIEISFDCPVCKSHYAMKDFWDENQEKWDRSFKESE